MRGALIHLGVWRTPTAVSSSNPRGFSGGGLATFPLEGREHLVHRVKGPSHAAFPDILQPLGNGPVNHGFRRKRDLAPLHSGLQQIADMDSDFVPHAPRDHDLIFVFYGDDGHGFGITVELFIFSIAGYSTRSARRATGDENTMLVVGTPKSSSFSTTRPNSSTLSATTFKMNASPPVTWWHSVTRSMACTAFKNGRYFTPSQLNRTIASTGSPSASRSSSTRCPGCSPLSPSRRRRSAVAAGDSPIRRPNSA